MILKWVLWFTPKFALIAIKVHLHSPNSTLTPKILFGTEAGNSFFNPLVWPAKANSSRRNEEKVFQFPSTTAFKIQKL